MIRIFRHFSSFSISFSKQHIHIYEKQEFKKDVPRQCARCGLANICASTCTRFQPFIDLLTRRHPTVLFLHSFSLCLLFFFFIGYIVSISKESAAFLHNRLGGSGLEKPRRTTNFVITQNKGKPD